MLFSTKLIILSAFLLAALLVGVYMWIVMIHISDYKQYTRVLPKVTRVYIILVIGVVIFGAYKILSDTTPLGPQIKIRTHSQF